MDWASLFYLGVTIALVVILAWIGFRTYRRGNKKRLEEPKYRMMDDD
jgi:hypothetical protein